MIWPKEKLDWILLSTLLKSRGQIFVHFYSLVNLIARLIFKINMNKRVDEEHLLAGCLQLQLLLAGLHMFFSFFNPPVDY